MRSTNFIGHGGEISNQQEMIVYSRSDRARNMHQSPCLSRHFLHMYTIIKKTKRKNPKYWYVKLKKNTQISGGSGLQRSVFITDSKPFYFRYKWNTYNLCYYFLGDCFQRPWILKKTIIKAPLQSVKHKQKFLYTGGE